MNKNTFYKSLAVMVPAGGITFLATKMVLRVGEASVETEASPFNEMLLEMPYILAIGVAISVGVAAYKVFQKAEENKGSEISK
jgi:hypothetical protein